MPLIGVSTVGINLVSDIFLRSCWEGNPITTKRALTRRYVLQSMNDLEPAMAAMDDLGYWAAYDIPRCGTLIHRVIVEKGAAAFAKALRELYAKGRFTGAVCVATAAAEKFLVDPQWEDRVRAALNVVSEAKDKEDEIALRQFRGLLRSTGNKPGPRTKRQTHERMIEVIRRIHDSGEGVKEISGADEAQKLSRALHASLRRFCLEVYDEWMRWSLTNPPDAPEAYNSLIEKHLTQAFGFELPAEKPLAEFAFNRAKNNYRASHR